MRLSIISSVLLLFFTFFSSAQVLDDENFIRVDQFGYIPDGYKVAVIAKAINGFNSGTGIDLNLERKIELCKVDNDSVVFSDYATVWNNSKVDSYSGDKGWWFNFSGISAEGEYYIKAYKTNGDSVKSYSFKISDDVYEEILRVAMNMFYYQRVNQDKTAEYASGEKWTDAPWYSRSNQDINAKYLYNSTTRDVSKGWIDAGDPNKYVTFVVPVVHNLLTTYGTYTEFWDSFDLKIPESNNTVPDILDEIKWEIDWLKNMQDYPGSGGLYIKAGIRNDHNYISPPSTDTRQRYYEQICPSASVIGAGMMAHAALYFKEHDELSEYADSLTTRAIAAWDYYSNASQKDKECDSGQIEAGDADGAGGHYAKEHAAEATCAAVYLFALTGEEKYNTFVKNNYRKTRPWMAGDWSVYRTNQGEAVMFYTSLPNADETTKNSILNKKLSSEKSTGSNYELIESDNLYRAKSIYNNWGSNSLMSAQGNDIMDFLVYELKPELHLTYEERAQSIINYMHGINPFGMTYLSNMYMYGGELCADEMWHTWFAPGTKYDNIAGNNVGPAPGFLSGGFNSQAGGNSQIKIGTQTFPGEYTKDQPSQKAFTVDNHWQYQPWQFNEPAIYYQSNYVKLLTNFVAREFSSKTQYALSASGENGKVNPKSGNYYAGTKVEITAFAEPGYEFKRWSGDFSDTINPAMVTMDTDKNIVAEFIKQDSTACIIGNPGFESGLFSWINNGGAELTEDANSGQFAIQCSDKGGLIDDALIPVGANKYFTFSFFVKKATGTGRAMVGIEFLDENENRITQAQSQNFGYEYEEKLIEREIPNRSVFIRVFIDKQTDAGSIFVDDFCLSLSEVNPNAFLLTVENGTGSGYYEAKSLVTVVADEAEEGYKFTGWTGDTIYMTDPGSSFSRFLMPDTSMTITANYDTSVGVHDFYQDGFEKVNIYPNPANKYISVEGLQDFTFQIHNLQGEEILNGKGKSTSKINIENIDSGVYFIRLLSANKEQVEKLIIQK